MRTVAFCIVLTTCLFFMNAPDPVFAEDMGDVSFAARTSLIEHYLWSAGCRTFPDCLVIAEGLAATGMTDAATTTHDDHNGSFLFPACVGEACISAIPFGPIAPLQPALPPYELLNHLQTLFTLNAAFASASFDLLTPGPATLGNIIVLYQLFLAPTP